MSDYRWSLGTLIWLPVCVLLIVGLLYVIRLLRRYEQRERGDRYSMAAEAKILWVVCIVVIAGLVLFTAAGMWPYKAEYHQWRETSGVVESIDSRFLGGSSGSTTERFVVTFDDGRQRSCDDTRCAQVHEGDELTLACKRAWQWSGSHGYDCNYVSHEVTA